MTRIIDFWGHAQGITALIVAPIGDENAGCAPAQLAGSANYVREVREDRRGHCAL